MKDLTPGFYYIGFDTAKSGHAISLIIEDHKKGYLVDPNYGHEKNIRDHHSIIRSSRKANFEIRFIS